MNIVEQLDCKIIICEKEKNFMKINIFIENEKRKSSYGEKKLENFEIISYEIKEN